MGGNGSAKRIMKEIDRLPIRDYTYEGKEVEKPLICEAASEETDLEE